VLELKPPVLERVFGMLDGETMMKTCTNCNETVREEARRCQFCSFRFDVTAATWPAKLNLVAAIALGGGTVVAFTAPAVAIPQLAIAVALFVAGTLGRRAARRRQFALRVA
jgi:hypothetical protein